jgi:hypothetical protein
LGAGEGLMSSLVADTLLAFLATTGATTTGVAFPFGADFDFGAGLF